MDIHTNPAAMEPLLPREGNVLLSELTSEILQASGQLTGQIHSPKVLERVSDLIQSMNCYYSNLIEGHKTTPREIEQALRQDFSGNEIQRDNQLMSIAHIEVEKLMASRLTHEEVNVYSPEFITWLHGEFYRRLPESLHQAKTISGKLYRIEPGRLRDYQVDVGHHTPPDFASLPLFLQRFEEAYGKSHILEIHRLTTIAAAHHRLAWIHPFGDGNGRVVRLHTHALFIHHGYESHGLWTLSRGLARHRQHYYDFLERADQPRRNDLDGRGHLSEGGLMEFCQFFLETILDQIRFMSGMLDLSRLRTRVERYFQFTALHLTRHREALMQVVRVLVDEGEIPRSRVQEITGKGATVSAEIIKLGLEEGLIGSASPKGPLHIVFPEKILEYYFPQLFLDLPSPSPQDANERS